MPYYPKNKIQTNLFTNSDRIVQVSTLEPYTGPYYMLSNGKMYKGANPSTFRYPEEIIDLDNTPRSPNSPVINKITDSSVTNTNIETVGKYIAALEDKPTSRLLPTPFYPKPSLQDYKRGYFTRYFVKQVNDYSFIEIDSKTYTNIQQKNSEYLWELYYVTEFPWQIRGNATDVYKTNESIVYIQEKNNFRGLSKFLRENYVKYYIGEDFHVMPDGRIMEGKTHKESKKLDSVKLSKKLSKTLPTSPNSPTSNNANRGGY